jgi:hypothetical protein
MPQFGRFHCCKPSPLLFIQPTHQQVQLMVLLQDNRVARLTILALTLMDDSMTYGYPPDSLVPSLV